MNARRFVLLIPLGIALAVLLFLPLASAATPLPPTERSTDLLMEGSPAPALDAPVDASHVAAAQGDIAVGPPGLAYRYVRSLGTSEQAYLADTTHLNVPYGIAVQGNNVWIAESFGVRALRFSSGGDFMGSVGTAGFLLYRNQAFGWMADVAVDGDGDVWIADGIGYVVQYDASGKYKSQIGTPNQSGSGNAQFGPPGPVGITFDSAGNVYISDGVQWWSHDVGNQRVQIFSQDGVYLATLGQTGVSGSDNAHFYGPRHIEVYDQVLYVVDSGNHRVQLFNVASAASPVYLATLGVTGQSGNDTSHLNDPSGVAVDATSIYVADTGNHRIQIFDRATRAYVATIGSGPGMDATQFNRPTDVAVDAAGNLYVADFVNTRVQQFNASRSYVRTYGTTGVPYVTDGQHLNRPMGLTVDQQGSLFIAEEGGHRLVKLDAAGVFQFAVGAAGVKGDWDNSNDRLNNPSDVALDSQGRLYVADKWHGRVQVYNGDGSYATSVFGSSGASDGFGCPEGLFIDAEDRLYVADPCNQRVVILASSFSLIATLGVLGESGTDNGHFNEPVDVVVDATGTIYVADRFNHRVQVFDANRAYVRTIGEAGVSGWDFAHFNGPWRLAVDGKNRLYVADNWNNRVQVFAADGAYLTTLSGSWGNGSGQLRNASGVAVDEKGNVYVADYHNHRIQQYALGVPGWVQANINGFGDITNGNVHTLAAFQGQLYAGTYNDQGKGAQLWRMNAARVWSQPAPAGFGVGQNVGLNHLLAFKDDLYAGVRNDSDGGRIYRSANGSGWQPVVTSGFGDPNTSGVYRLAVFAGQLYAGTSIFTTTHGAEIWRSASGDAGSWERVVEDGFDSRNHYIMRISAVHDGALYFGTQNIDTATFMTTTGGIVLRSDTGAAGSWRKVTANGLGNIHNYAISGLVSFDGYLYASTSRWDWHGVEVWRCQTCDRPQDWQKVVDNGLGNRNAWGISTLQVFEGQLYLVVGNGREGLEVWRSASGASGTWQPLLRGGFGDSNNTSPYYNNVMIFGGNLYVGTQNSANGPEVWLYLDDQIYLPTVRRP